MDGKVGIVNGQVQHTQGPRREWRSRLGAIDRVSKPIQLKTDMVPEENVILVELGWLVYRREWYRDNGGRLLIHNDVVCECLIGV
jgi:hypothetical protein